MVQEWFWHKSDLMWPWNLYLYNDDILEKFLKDLALNKTYIAEKDDFEILWRPYVTFNDLWGYTKFYQKIASS